VNVFKCPWCKERPIWHSRKTCTKTAIDPANIYCHFHRVAACDGQCPWDYNEKCTYHILVPIILISHK
jgi:hypothetical protein